MNRNAPIVVIEDDEDDQAILKEVFEKLNCHNEIIYFLDGQAALDFLHQREVIPFLILCDINMPKLDGFELKRKLNADTDLELKCIPYLFFTTAANQKSVIDAYRLSAQGFFTKQASMEETEKSIKVILDYWRLCTAPNNFGEDEGKKETAQ